MSIGAVTRVLTEPATVLELQTVKYTVSYNGYKYMKQRISILGMKTTEY